MNDQKLQRKAQRRAGAKLSFIIHLSVFVAVNLILVAINFATSSEYLWFVWPLFGWSIGLAFHALGVFVFSGSGSLNEKMVEQELEKLQSKRDTSS